MVEGRITIRVIMMRDGTPSSPNQVSGILFLSATKPVLDAAVTYAKQSHIPTLSLTHLAYGWISARSRFVVFRLCKS